MAATPGYLELTIRSAGEQYHPARGRRHPDAERALRPVVMVLLSLLVSHTALAAEPSFVTQPGGSVIVGEEIFGNEAAARKVVEARTYDPMSCPEDRRNRDNAISLYIEAIALQPNAPINAALANRIAQMYASYLDPKTGVEPDPAKAAEWWERAATMADRRNLLWAQLQMGLASAHVMDRDPVPAIEACKRIIAINPEELQLPAWRTMGSPKFSAADQARWRQDQLEPLRARGAEIRLEAVDQLAIACNRLGPEAKAAILDDIASKYHGTPVGDMARSLRPKLASRIELPNNALPHSATMPAAQTQPATRPVAQQLPESVADRGSKRWTWGAIAVCLSALGIWAIISLKRKFQK